MIVSNAQESTGPIERKLYLGIENFEITAVNPSMQELNDMGMSVTEEPVYVTKVERDFGDGPKEYDAVNIRIFLDNKNATNSIKTQVNYTIIDAYHLSSTGKIRAINKYGSDAWLKEEEINSKIMPSNMEWYVTDEVKKCLRGEEQLVSFIKAFRSLPNISKNSDELAKSKGQMMFEKADIDKLFKGDFKDIRNVLMHTETPCKVGFLLGIRTLEDRKVQSLYKEYPLKRYIKSTNYGTNYLTEAVHNSIQNGAYSTVYFDLENLTLTEYVEDVHEVKSTKTDELIYQNQEDDDLPF